jgi:hypothetical protein
MWGVNDLNHVATAARKEDWGTVRAALRSGMPPDARGDDGLFGPNLEPSERSVSIFMWVVSHHNVDLAAEFVAAGADVLAPPGTYSSTPMHSAAASGNVAMLKTLGAQNYVHAPNGRHGGNLLHILARYGRLKALEWVFGAAPDAPTALFVADPGGLLPVDRCGDRDGSIRYPACVAFLRAYMTPEAQQRSLRWTSLRAAWVQAVVAVGPGK